MYLFAITHYFWKELTGGWDSFRKESISAFSACSHHPVSIFLSKHIMFVCTSCLKQSSEHPLFHAFWMQLGVWAAHRVTAWIEGHLQCKTCKIWICPPFSHWLDCENNRIVVSASTGFQYCHWIVGNAIGSTEFGGIYSELCSKSIARDRFLFVSVYLLRLII